MRSLGTKLILEVSAVTILLVAGFGTLGIYLQQKGFATILDAKAARTMQQLSIALRTPLWNMAYAQVDEILHSYLTDDDILMIRVTENEGTASHLGKNPKTGELVDLGQNASQTFEYRDAFTKQIKIEYAGDSVGSVEAIFSRQFILTQRWKFLVGSGIFFLALMGLQALMLSFLVRYNVLIPLGKVVRMARKIGEGNLTVQLAAIKSRDEMSQVIAALKHMILKLNSTLLEVRTTAENVATGSQAISAIAEQVSEGSAEQAAAAQEASSSMEQMAANIRQNAENAKVTEAIAIESSEDARQGGKAVAETIVALKRIEERISIVQDIAMQTNILSINATIEAAKAQEYGRGFAVVASEVRGLAKRSREAAEEIKGLVKSCVTISEQAGVILQRLVPNSEKTAELVQEINAASREQYVGVEQINGAIQQLDQVIQQNAATAEQMASSSETLAAQAEQLQEGISFFTVNELTPKLPPEKADVKHALQTPLKAKGTDEHTVPAFLTTLSASPARSPEREKFDTQNSPLHASSDTGKTGSAARDELDEEFERF